MTLSEIFIICCGVVVIAVAVFGLFITADWEQGK